MSAIGPIRPVATPPAAPERAPASAAPLDAPRAERLRAAIEAGDYPLDARRLAERLIALGLFGKGEGG